MDGESIVPYLKNSDRRKERTLVWHYPHYHGSTWRPGSAIRQGNWKLIEFYEDNSVELYNLSNDIEEQKNIAEQYPDKTEMLRKEMHSYIKARNGKYPALRTNR
ncbi:DUF4976 domain-containing protein [Rhodohalobacter sp. WB101]|uniref:DUF4976 domain-containing protein n=2 Tax=Rhodohalobacter sulfatireducens TaxID=2911366 RepID=A0ABS9KHC3_9BACT|nr:DUF4976 domain-containing protein [Rhodohalobacter sulfatireducens]